MGGDHISTQQSNLNERWKGKEREIWREKQKRVRARGKRERENERERERESVRVQGSLNFFTSVDRSPIPVT